MKGSVEGVGSAMEAGKEDMTKKIITVGQGMENVQEGQAQLKGEIEKNTTAIEKNKRKPGRNRNNKRSDGEIKGGRGDGDAGFKRN